MIIRNIPALIQTSLYFLEEGRGTVRFYLLNNYMIYECLLEVWLGIYMIKEFPILLVDSIHSFKLSASHLFCFLFLVTSKFLPRTFVELG